MLSSPPIPAAPFAEDPLYLRTQLITYLGNKRALLPFIGRAVECVRERLGGRRLAAADLFSGTGVVARFLKQACERLIVNDLERYSEITNQCYLANRDNIDSATLDDALAWLNDRIARCPSPGFITELYAPRDESTITSDDRVFYTRRNAVYLDTARQAIDHLPAELRLFFLGPLLAAASVHANTSGVFKGFYKNANGVGQFGGHGRDALSRILRPIAVSRPVLSRFDCAHTVHRADANALVGQLPFVDLVYLDPPYNQHPYGSNYFMLNLLADYRRPAAVSRVSGIPTDWNRSRYNQRAEAEATLFDLIDRCPAAFVLISYNGEGFVPQDHFVEHLQRRGTLTRMEIPYNTFRGSRNLRGRAIHVTEFLYLLEKR
ncbi:MAG TPA: DNA adenine methylase [Tepidisphaeraceae bacterium]|jgi:adenine-specific DNA-methyltransferase